MPYARLSLLPLAGPVLQLSLLAPLLVLMVISVTTAPTGSHFHHYLQLPDTSPAQFIVRAEDDLWLSILEDGSVFIDAKWYPPAEFLTCMRRISRRSHPPRVVLRADRAVPFSTVRLVLRGVQTANLRHAFFVTAEASPLEVIASRRHLTPACSGLAPLATDARR